MVAKRILTYFHIIRGYSTFHIRRCMCLTILFLFRSLSRKGPVSPLGLDQSNPINSETRVAASGGTNENRTFTDWSIDHVDHYAR